MATASTLTTTTLILRYILTLQLFLGGQARLTSRLTPTLHRRAMAKAAGTQRHLPFIPIRDPARHTNVIGALMCAAGTLLCAPQTRLAGGALAICLTLAGVYTQYRMGIPWWLPAVNTVLAGLVIWGEVGRG